jgi:cytochrome P450
MVEARMYPLTKPLLAYILPKFLGKSAADHRKYSADKADRRMQLQTDRPDFMSYILKHNETEKGMTLAEIREGASVFILAGSETVSLYIL